MLIFLDTEFAEDGRVIDLLSLGLVRGDGRTYYAQVLGFQPSLALPWVKENVFPHLQRCYPEEPLEAEIQAHKAGACSTYCPWRDRATLAQELVRFAGPAPEFWADYAAYDWVALCQVFGTMLRLPKGWPMFARDVQQLGDVARRLDPKFRWPARTGVEHHALSDARDCAARFEDAAAALAKMGVAEVAA